MISNNEKEYIDKILDALTKAAAGDYSTNLSSASANDPLESIADAVNTLLAKTDKRIASLTQFVEDQTQDARRYRNILDSIQESYFEVDLKGNINFFNDRAMQDLGYDREDLRGMNFKQLTDDINAKKVYDAFHSVFLTGQPLTGFDWEILKKDKGEMDVESSVALLRNEKGDPVGFRGVVRNISQRKQAEKNLRKSEAKYRTTLDVMEEGYIENDLSGRIIFANDTACRFLGYEREALIGMHYRDYLTPKVASQMQAVFNRVYTTSRPELLVDYDIAHRDGSVRTYQMNVALIYDDSGKPGGFRVLKRDVTEKIKSRRIIEENERHLRLITDNIHDIIWTMDFNLHYTYLSPSVSRVTGFTPEEIMKIPFKSVIPPATYAFFEQALADYAPRESNGQFKDEQINATFEIQLLHKNGSPIWVEISAAFNRDENGKPFEIVGVTRDITERKKTEEKLKESEKRYRMMAENVNDVVWTIGLDMKFIYASPSQFRISGFTPEEIINISFSDFVTPESFDLATQTLSEELALETSGKPFDPNRSRTLVLEIYSKNGDNVWMEVNTTFNRDANGNPTEILAVGRNITSRRIIEKALAESEQRYRMIVENMQDVICIMDFNFQFTYVSNSNIKLTGYTKEEVTNVPIDKLLTPESMQLIIQTFGEELEREKIKTQPDNQVIRTMELEIRHKNGGTTWAEVTATFNRDENGKAFEILFAAREITERKKIQEALKASEQRYRMIVENMHEVIWTTDLNLQYTYVSPSSLRLIGYTPEELISMPIYKILTPDSFTQAQTAVGEELTREFSGEPVDPYRSRTIEQELHHKNGGIVWLEVTATFTRDENGKPIGMLMAGRDISARKKALEEKNNLEMQLMQAQKMETVGRLAGGVAHDFNNMLSVILGYVDLAKLRLAKHHPVLKDIAEIEKAAVRSRDITTQLLAFSRKQIIEPRIIDLNEMVAHTKKSLARLIGEDLRLNYHPGEDLWAIKFDPSQIEQILMNLAVNARDAMPDGGELTIETENIILDNFYCENHIGFTPGDYIQLIVSDNGVGMDKETLQHIFEPFFTTKEAGKGTGLGLATVYGIVKQNNGFINVYSEPGHGTTFTIYLPRTTEEKEDQEAEDEPEFTGTGNILLVEDDPMVLQIARGMLESIGYVVTVKGNPKEAIALFEQNNASIDLVITDVIMPGISGKDLRDKLVELRPDIKVLFMSGYTADVIAHHGVLEKGAQFLQKPFTMKALAVKVSEAMAAK